MNSKNIKLLNESGLEICDVLALSYIDGKFNFFSTPDFCGFSSKSINTKQSDKVIFKINENLIPGILYKLKYQSGHIITIKIENSSDNNYYADVIKD